MKMFGKSRKNSKAEAEVVGTPFDQADKNCQTSRQVRHP